MTDTPTAGAPKAAWPKTEEGTTDWQYVFEDPDAGIIPLLSQAQSAAGLKMSAAVVIEKLFTRRNDALERERLINQLDDIITGGGDDVEVMIKGVSKLMRAIKDERLEKARIYIQRKHAGAAIDRRAGLLWQIDMLLRPAVLVPVGIVFVAILSGLVYVMLQSALGPETQTADTPVAVDQAAPEATEQASVAPKEELPPTEMKPEPIPIWFKTLRWPLATKYTKDRPQYYSVILTVMDWDHKTEICRRLPTVMDRFYQSFSLIMPLDRKARQEEIDALQIEIASAINRLLPSNYVTDVKVARYGTKDFRAAVRPPFCTSPGTPPPSKIKPMNATE